MPDSVVIRATIMIATIGYAAAEWLRVRRPAAWRMSRLIWTIGALSIVVHSAAAFHYRYGWSHTHAIQATAQQTAAVTGLDWGGGLFVNYAFVAIWTTDAAWWWIGPASYAARPRALSAALAAVFLFMFVNGAVVFAHGAMRWIGAASVLVVCAAFLPVPGSRTPVCSAQPPVPSPRPPSPK
jgi:hypothetical protein